MLKSLSALALSLVAVAATAGPAYLITHNNTDVESNAYIAGIVPSPYPTAAHSTRRVYWNLVKIACHDHMANGQCSALIKIATETANPITLGTVSMNLQTGEITPKQLTNEGYTLTVDKPGETTITKINK